MTEPTHYHQRIQRATERLAQMQARELIANRRLEYKARLAAKRELSKRRKRIVDLIIMAKAETLEDAELLGALLQHMRCQREPGIRQQAASLGAKKLCETAGVQ